MRDAGLDETDRGELHAVDHVIHAVVAEQLELLDTDGRQERQRCHALGGCPVKLEPDAAAHGEADDVDAIHSEVLQQLDAIPRV